MVLGEDNVNDSGITASFSISYTSGTYSIANGTTSVTASGSITGIADATANLSSVMDGDESGTASQAGATGTISASIIEYGTQ
jgi:hypothetical protein